MGLVLVSAVMGVPAVSRAVEQQELSPFELVAVDGRAVRSSTLARPGRWVLIYVPVSCGGCDALLRLIVKADQPRLPAQVAIIVGHATVDTVLQAAPQFPDLEEAAWYADPTGAASGPLQVGFSPAVFGMRGNAIEWTVSGVLGSSADVAATMTAWVSQ
jgi:hypothetical protein